MGDAAVRFVAGGIYLLACPPELLVCRRDSFLFKEVRQRQLSPVQLDGSVVDSVFIKTVICGCSLEYEILEDSTVNCE